MSADELDELSRADLRVLGEIWSKFGFMNQMELVEFTHEYCKEWIDPKGSSSEIPFERVFHYLGRENSEELAAFIIKQRQIDTAFS